MHIINNWISYITNISINFQLFQLLYNFTVTLTACKIEAVYYIIFIFHHT